VNALIKHAHELPHELYRSLTWDRGKEMADHQRFTLATDIKVYFCSSAPVGAHQVKGFVLRDSCEALSTWIRGTDVEQNA
jgi:hypothetical protein